LVDQGLEKKDNHAKHIIIAVAILAVLLAGIGGGVMMLMGSMGDEEETTAETAEGEAAEDAEEPTRIADIPKASIDKAKEVVAQVNAKASTDEILGASADEAMDESRAGEGEQPAVAANQPSSVAPSASSSAPPTLSVTPTVNYAKQNPDVIDWVESLERIQFGRGKLIINNQAYTKGQVVNETLNVRWIQADQALGILIFEDANGVEYEKDF